MVEQLAKNRQPFPDMDVIYLASPTIDSARKICGDFESKQKAKYGSVHIFFIEAVRYPISRCPEFSMPHTIRVVVLFSAQMMFSPRFNNARC